MPKFDDVGYLLIHKDKGKVELHPNPWEWPRRQKHSLYRRLINWLTGRSPDSY